VNAHPDPAASESAPRIGLIAGNGQFPLLFARAAVQEGYRVFAAAFSGEADPGLEALVYRCEWMHLGQVRRMIRFFRSHGVDQAVMIGAIHKTRMFSDVRPDLKAIAILAQVRHTQDDRLLSAFADALQREGIAIRASTFLLPNLLAPAGCWTKRRPRRAEMKEIAFGWRMAKEIGRLDIGQCVVIGGGSVLAVEAIDGTDATLRRGGALGRGNAIAVKICKPGQDQRFDMPAVGAQTVETMRASGIGLLALEAAKAVVFDRSQMVRLADEGGICLVGLQESDIVG
jgi:hypothetical protein